MAQDVAHEARREERRPQRQEPAAEAPETKASPRRRRGPSGKTVLPEHAVFLVPGLLGFERFSNFGYFADRVVAALRASLEQTWNQPVPVVPVPILPTASLRERQIKLVRTLADRLHALEHEYQPLRVHLIGHSTGGVDCHLLTQDAPVGGGSWDDIDPRTRALLDRIRSVITIGSPHQGACITRDPVARLLQQRDLRGLPDFAGLLARFGASALGDLEFGDLLFSAKRELTKSAGFLRRVLARWELIDDLQPSRAPAPALRRRGVLRRTFVTVAGQPKPGAGAASSPDAFFRALSARASGWSTGCAEEGPLVMASVARLEQALADKADRLLIKAPSVDLPAELDAGHSDGVVNAARQLIDPSDPDELAGIVVSDHFDVVGYYDRRVWITDEHGREQSTLVLSGLLHSGSSFRDPQFFELYRRVADAIAQAGAQ
jgi:pimeloyl-ACP methyl ester carboxylesterase